MKPAVLTGLVAVLFVLSGCSPAINLSRNENIDDADQPEIADKWQESASKHPGYQLVWSDEFDGTALNQSYWNIITGTGNNGWGNQEWQYYTARPENLRIVEGNLVIEARKESYGGQSYTSARISTEHKQTFTYGRIEARIKSPAGGHGIWPAFWMLGENIGTVGWPACGEIDIYEMMSESDKALGTLHYGSQQPVVHESNGGNLTYTENLGNDYHLFAIEWSSSNIRWFVDDINFYSSSTWWSSTGDYPAPYNKPFYILLNFAVGSSWWDRQKNQDTVTFPQQMLIDYVRVYQKTE